MYPTLGTLSENISRTVDRTSVHQVALVAKPYAKGPIGHAHRSDRTFVRGCPPKLYGGTERVVFSLTEALVDMGHNVTLFASGDSITSAKLDAPWPRALRLDPDIRDWVSTYAMMIEYVCQRAHLFDVLHFHIDYWPNSVFLRQDVPFVTTLHGRLDLPEFAAVYRMFPTVPLVSISNSQRLPVPDLGWAATVYHGMSEACSCRWMCRTATTSPSSAGSP